MQISIITPTFNSDMIIARNVNSILSQSYNNFEHIIIDNLMLTSEEMIIRKYLDSLETLQANNVELLQYINVPTYDCIIDKNTDIKILGKMLKDNMFL